MALDVNQIGSVLGQSLQKYSDIHQQGQDPNQFSHDKLTNDYQQLSSQASPEQIFNANQQHFETMSEEKRKDLFSNLTGSLQQQGVSTQQAGVEDDIPTPSNLAKIIQYDSSKPELFQSILGKTGVLNSPMAKTVLSGALTYAAKSMNK